MLAVIWNWFISGIGNMPDLTTLGAVGILVVVNLIKADFVKIPEESKRTMAYIIGLQLAGPAVFLGFGWVFYLLLNVKVSF